MTTSDRPDAGEQRVLLILDHEDERRTATAILEGAGYGVKSRTSPIGATVEIVRAGIDAVVIDVHIAVMSGDRFAALVRRNDRLDHVGLVLLSNESPPEIARLVAEVGADAGLPRSALGSALLDAVKKALARAGSLRPSHPPVASGSKTILILRTDRFALPLVEGRQLIGRDPDCRFVLNHPSVSRQHAAVEVHGIRARIEDLGSSNGTLVNDVVVEGERDLDIGDVIRIGDEELVLAVRTQISRETAQLDKDEI
jgi:CheY-like chemotaxis protein